MRNRWEDESLDREIFTTYLTTVVQRQRAETGWTALVACLLMAIDLDTSHENKARDARSKNSPIGQLDKHVRDEASTQSILVPTSIFCRARLKTARSKLVYDVPQPFKFQVDNFNMASQPMASSVISPLGLPNTAKGKGKAPEPEPENVANAEPTQMDDTTNEVDDDEDTGARPLASTNGGDATNRTYGTLLPTLSTSKYAAYRRKAGGRTGPLPPGVTKPDHWLKDAGPVKVEAKVWLANQRTFVKWQHVSALLASLSLGLYNAAGVDNRVARGLAVVYTVVACLAAAWGYGVYVWRARMIRGRSGKDFDARLGPVVVCVGLIIALVLNFAFKVRSRLWKCLRDVLADFRFTVSSSGARPKSGREPWSREWNYFATAFW